LALTNIPTLAIAGVDSRPHMRSAASTEHATVKLPPFLEDHDLVFEAPRRLIENFVIATAGRLCDGRQLALDPRTRHFRGDDWAWIVFPRRLAIVLDALDDVGGRIAERDEADFART
jgi:hypothetical protein